MMTRSFLISALVTQILFSGLTAALFFPGRAQEAMTGGEVGAQDLLVVFWNVENLFDCDGENGGEEWSPAGEKHWTPGRLRAKCNAIGKTLLWIGEQEGRLPDIVGLAEVENAEVLRRLVYSAPLRKAGYHYVHFDSPDPRGIDVALLYRKDVLPRPIADVLPIPGFRTRDMLQCRFPLSDPKPDNACSAACQPVDSLTVIVVHHPSKLGGSARSQPRRQVAMSVLRDACRKSQIVVTGDFNDTPDGEAFRMLDSCLVCLSRTLYQRGEGSLKYDGKWELIDQFWVSPDLAGETAADSSDSTARRNGSEDGTPRWRCETTVIYAPFLLTRDSAHAGEKPLRTYSGPRYLGGVSDHLPIVLRLSKKDSPGETDYSSRE